MNDTTRDELVTEVIDIYAEPENFPREDASEHAENILRLIDDAVAARDAEIRERLDLIYDEVRCENTDGMGGQDQHTAGYLEGLSVAIGLLTHGDGTGGQG